MPDDDIQPDNDPTPDPAPTPPSGGGDPDPAGADRLGDPGKRALDAMKRERNAAREENKKLQARLDELDNAGKTEVQRATDAAAAAASRAERAESGFAAMQAAMDRAPTHATLAQVRAVAKRIRGDNEEALHADADELFELLAPKPAAKDDEPKDEPKGSVPGKPRPRLKSGGADPEDEPEEADPRKLAALISDRKR